MTRPPLPAAPEVFVLRGKVAVTEAGEHFTANLLWHQRGAGFEMDLWGPLGQGRVRIVRERDEVRIANDQGVVMAGEPDRVMREQLGWSLPLDVLPAWVQGAPLSGVPAEALVRDEEGRFVSFTQLGWSVALERYESLAAGARALPTRITAIRADARVRLVVSEWRL
ncbi:MAG: lipoprotein insertase outer membrane protein LolB [Pseudomonadales bacterium]